MAIIAKKSAEVALHDTNEISENSGFVVDVTGVLEMQCRNDSADVSMPVVAGAFYPFDIKLAKSTGTTGVTRIVVIFGKGY